MEAPTKDSVILFDLDNTLFDHQHSLRCGIQAIRTAYPLLSSFRDEKLTTIYNRSLHQAYDSYLHGDISYSEKDMLKIGLFFAELGLNEPNAEEIRGFRDIYSAAYRSSCRATPGSVETLALLKGLRYRLAIVTNGQIKDQHEKAEAIGVLALVEHVFTSDEIGAPKPDPIIFRAALDTLRADSSNSFMIGDNPDSDIQGALNVGLQPILFEPQCQETEHLLLGKRVPVIRDMWELLGFLGILK